MFKKVLLYGLPLYLYGLEFLLKAFASIRADSVAGPTLAGAALGFLIPLTELKEPPIGRDLLDQLKAAGANAHMSSDKTFSDFVWVFFFASLGAWMVCIYLTLQPLHQPARMLNTSLLIGCIIFVFSIVLAEIKERI